MCVEEKQNWFWPRVSFISPRWKCLIVEIFTMLSQKGFVSNVTSTIHISELYWTLELESRHDRNYPFPLKMILGWITDRKVGQIIIGSILSAAAQSPNCRELTLLAYCRVGQNDSRGKQIAVVEISAHFIARCLDKPLKLMAWFEQGWIGLTDICNSSLFRTSLLCQLALKKDRKMNQS